MTRAYGLSLGDRGRLALSRIEKARALTTDGRWRTAVDALDITIEDIRRGSPRY